MAEGKRPGGLTALAVLNFVFGGLGAIGTLLAFGAISLIKKGIEAAEAAGGTVKYDGQGLAAAYIVVLCSGIGAVLLIVSGIGYLGQKRMMAARSAPSTRWSRSVAPPSAWSRVAASACSRSSSASTRC